MFDFVECTDPRHQILWNIESKVDPIRPNKTVSVEDFVDRQYEVFAGSAYKRSITVSKHLRTNMYGMLRSMFSTKALTGELSLR